MLHRPSLAPKLYGMTALTAQDLWPLVSKLSHEEQVRLAKLALAAAGHDPGADVQQYRSSPPGPDELKADPDALAWESEGWDGFDAPR